ncbi:9068_t:CDS:2, partial [Dentiscutata heterogama]
HALTSKQVVEVAAFFFDIFTIFRPPLILQSDNGKEFVSLLVFGVLLHRYSAALDYLFETSIFLEDEIPNEFGLKNIQESINSLGDLIDNINSILLIEIKSSSSFTSLNKDLSLDNENQETVTHYLYKIYQISYKQDTKYYRTLLVKI